MDDVAGSNDALEQSVLAPSGQQSIGRPNVAQQRPRTRDPPPATDPMTGINFNEMQVQAVRVPSFWSMDCMTDLI